MPGIALRSANQGRLRPSFFFCAVGLLVAAAQAQQVVYRCGQEYTNAPMDTSRCERLSPQAITIVSGTRVQGASLPGPAVTPSPASGVAQVQRDDMARSIVSAELEQAQRRHADLLAEYRQGQPMRTPEETQTPAKYQERVARLKAAVERSQRDIDSLQRELVRRP
jgi:hypothetical protein